MDTSFYDAWDSGLVSNVFITSVVFAVICPLTVLARVVGRYIYDLRLGLDDALIVLAMCFGMSLSIMTSFLAKWDDSAHIAQFNYPDLEGHYKLYMASQGFYKLTTTFGKISIILYYLGLFPQPKFRRTCWVLVGVLSVDALVYIFVLMLHCLPLEHAWDRGIPGRCINLAAFWVVEGAIEIVTVLVVLFLHVPVVFKSLLPREEKIGAFVQSGLGLSIFVAAVIKEVTVGNFYRCIDLTVVAAHFSLWTLIEANLTLVCACIPTFISLTAKFLSCAPRYRTRLRKVKKCLRRTKKAKWSQPAIWSMDDFGPEDNYSSYNDSILTPPPIYTSTVSLGPREVAREALPPDEELYLAMGCRVVKATRRYTEEGPITTYHSPQPTLAF